MESTINYILFDSNNKQIDLNYLPETSNLKDVFIVDKQGLPIQELLAPYKKNGICNSENIESAFC